MNENIWIRPVHIDDLEQIKTLAFSAGHGLTSLPKDVLLLKKNIEKSDDDIGVFLETAHPIKFSESVEKILSYVNNEKQQKKNIDEAFNYVCENFSFEKFKRTIKKKNLIMDKFVIIKP